MLFPFFPFIQSFVFIFQSCESFLVGSVKFHKQNQKLKRKNPWIRDKDSRNLIFILRKSYTHYLDKQKTTCWRNLILRCHLCKNTSVCVCWGGGARFGVWTWWGSPLQSLTTFFGGSNILLLWPGKKSSSASRQVNSIDV